MQKRWRRLAEGFGSSSVFDRELGASACWHFARVVEACCDGKLRALSAVVLLQLMRAIKDAHRGSARS